MMSVFLFISCLTTSDQEFAILDQGIDNLCEQVPDAENCQSDEESDLGDITGESDTDIPEDTSCNSLMRVRRVLPINNATTPVNTQPIVLTIGYGDETHLLVELINAQGEVVETNQTVDCYIHEGDEEFHCTYLLDPVNGLQANRAYDVRVRATEFHETPGDEYRSSFETNGSQLQMASVAPDIEHLGYMDRELSAVGECDWEGAKKYELMTTVPEPTRDNLSIVQVYEVDIQTNEESLVHSIILPKTMDEAQYRQVIKPGDEYPRCYRSEHLDVAGNISPTTETVCWTE